MVGNGANSQEALERALEARRDILVRFKNETLRQTGVLKASDVDAFVGSVDARQKLIDEISVLHQELDVLMQSYAVSEGQAVHSAGLGSDRARELTRETQALVTEILELDKKNVGLAQELMKHLGEEAKRANQSRKSIGLYNPEQKLEGSVYFDSKS